MFTGIIDHCGQVIRLEPRDTALRLWIMTEFSDWQLGESIAVDGICLTVIDFSEKCFACDISPETLKVTTALNFVVGTQVNIERAMRLDDRFGGHVVTGHVDTRGALVASVWQGEFLCLTFGALPMGALRYFCQKGSVAINGVSLTVNAVTNHAFEVMLIPHTLKFTNLGALVVGDTVNVEFDYLARYVVRQLDFK